MLSPAAACEVLDITPDQFDKRLARNPDLAVMRGGQVRIPHEAMRTLVAEAGKEFQHRRVTFGIEKGGVGKSFLAVNTAAAAAARGSRVLVVDLDPQACVTNLLLPEDVDYDMLITGLEVFTSSDISLADGAVASTCEGIDVVAAKGKMRRLRRLLSGRGALEIIRPHLEDLERYDLVIFDIPPSFSELLAAAYLCSDMVIMPVLPDIWSIESVELTLADIADMCAEENIPQPPCYILLNRFVPSRIASNEALETLQEHFPDLLLPFVVRHTAMVQNAINDGRTVFQQSCGLEVRQALLKLAAFISPLTTGSRAAGADEGGAG